MVAPAAGGGVGADRLAVGKGLGRQASARRPAPLTAASISTRLWSGSGTTEKLSTNDEPTASSQTGCQMPVVRV